MTNNKKVGRWARPFGQRLPFEKETASAKEIGARCTLLREGDWVQLNIELDPIAGWQPPMWGSDEKWLYLRRPEGIWKCAIPDFDSGATVQLCYRGTDGQLLGSDNIGQHIRAMGGWFWSMDTDKPMDAADRDEEVQGWAEEEGAPADQLGGYLDQVLEIKTGMTLIQVGDEFAEPPSFEIDCDWLIATDKHGWRVAYSLRNSPEAQAALRSGELWLSFGSPWMKTWIVKVA